MKNILLAIFFLFSFGTIAFAQQININCNPCYVKNCQCTVNCNTGKMYVYSSIYCIGTENSIIDFANYSAEFSSVQPGQFYGRVDCADNNKISSCQSIFVSAYPGQTTTTTQTIQTTQTTQTQPTQSFTATTIQTIQTRTTTGTQAETSVPVSINTILVIVLLFVVLVVVVGLLFYYKSVTSKAGNY